MYNNTIEHTIHEATRVVGDTAGAVSGLVNSSHEQLIGAISAAHSTLTGLTNKLDDISNSTLLSIRSQLNHKVHALSAFSSPVCPSALG